MDDLPDGNSVYYLRVINLSDSPQSFHIYEHFNDGKVTFANPDPNYTIVTPATANNGFSVGSYSGRISWQGYNGVTYSVFGETLNDITSYSGRGPRIDGYQKPEIVTPGTSVISIRDRDALTVPNYLWINNDGSLNGNNNYYIMQGTSMSAPVCAGAAALLLSRFPKASPLEIYDALKRNTIRDNFTGSVPNSTFGNGKLNINAAIEDLYLQWVNPYTPLNLFVSSDSACADTFHLLTSPSPGMGTGIKYGPDDWTYNNPSLNIYIAPKGTQSFMASQFCIEWDSTIASLSSASIGNFFNNPVFQYSVLSSGKLLVNISNLDGNSLPAGGKYLVKIILTLLKPGKSPINITGTSLKYYDASVSGFKEILTKVNNGCIKFYPGDFCSSDSVRSIGDGRVNYNDLVLFSLAYWGTRDSSGYRAKFDIGPSAGDYFSMPASDGIISFEDLAVFTSGYSYHAQGLFNKQINSKVALLTIL